MTSLHNRRCRVKVRPTNKKGKVHSVPHYLYKGFSDCTGNHLFNMEVDEGMKCSAYKELLAVKINEECKDRALGEALASWHSCSLRRSAHRRRHPEDNTPMATQPC